MVLYRVELVLAVVSLTSMLDLPQRFLGVSVPFEVQSLTGDSYMVVCELGVNPNVMTLMSSVDTEVCRIELWPCCEGAGNCQSNCYNVIEVDFFQWKTSLKLYHFYI